MCAKFNLTQKIEWFICYLPSFVLYVYGEVYHGTTCYRVCWNITHVLNLSRITQHCKNSSAIPLIGKLHPNPVIPQNLISDGFYMITWWWVLYSCRNCLLRQKSPCFDRKFPSGNSCCWTYPLHKIFNAKLAIKWSVYKLYIWKCYKIWNKLFFSFKNTLINT